MSRKHFIQLANALKAQRPQDSWSASEADCFRSQWNQDVLAIAAVCAAAADNRSNSSAKSKLIIPPGKSHES